MHRVRKFVEVDTGRIGYALTVDALSQASKGTKWNPDPSFSVGDAILDDPARFGLEDRFAGRPRNCSHGET